MPGFPIIKVLRDVRGMTQDELAGRAGLSKSYLSRVERGGPDGRDPSLATIRDLANVLGVPIAVLTGQHPPIAAIRRALHVWQGSPDMAEMAELLGVDPETYRRIENEQQEPTQEQLALIARRLGVPAALLWSLRTEGTS
jgi:transcriptional regulator with XRE-family HTH domain